MIQLDRHIEILLLSNDCVIVPGLGGFMAHHVCACYYTDTQSFLPPSRQLGFNANLQINDSLLAQSYIEAYDISYPEALRRIEDEVCELKQKLHNNGSCELNDIGVLRLNADGHIEFEPCEAGILTPDLYGLNHLDITPLASVSSHTEESETKHTSVTPIPQPIAPLANGKNAMEEDAENDVEEKEDTGYVKIRISTIRRVATAAAVIAVLCICAIPAGKLAQSQITKSAIDSNVLYNILPECLRVPAKDTNTKQIYVKQPKSVIIKNDDKKDVVKKDDDKKDVVKNDSVRKATEVKPVESKSDKLSADSRQEVKKETQSFFSIVLASKVSKTNAELFVSQLKENGFAKAEVMSRPSGTKVIYGHFKTEEEARTYLNNIRSQSDAFSLGWVMEFNP